jgi:hypothetical protein
VLIKPEGLAGVMGQRLARSAQLLQIEMVPQKIEAQLHPSHSGLVWMFGQLQVD